MNSEIKDIIIFDRNIIQHFAIGSDPHIIISITEPTLDFPKIKSEEEESKDLIGLLRLVFTDEDNPEIYKHSKQDKLFSDEQANQILDLVFNNSGYSLIVCQCDGGLSRSAGVAAALSVILKGNKADKWVFNGPYIPNRLVYRKIINNYLDHWSK